MIEKITNFFNNNPVLGIIIIFILFYAIMYFLNNKCNISNKTVEHLEGSTTSTTRSPAFDSLVANAGNKKINFKCTIPDADGNNVDYYLANIPMPNCNESGTNCNFKQPDDCSQTAMILVPVQEIQENLVEYLLNVQKETDICNCTAKVTCKHNASNDTDTAAPVDDSEDDNSDGSNEDNSLNGTVSPCIQECLNICTETNTQTCAEVCTDSDDDNCANICAASNTKSCENHCTHICDNMPPEPPVAEEDPCDAPVPSCVYNRFYTHDFTVEDLTEALNTSPTVTEKIYKISGVSKPSIKNQQNAAMMNHQLHYDTQSPVLCGDPRPLGPYNGAYYGVTPIDVVGSSSSGGITGESTKVKFSFNTRHMLPAARNANTGLLVRKQIKRDTSGAAMRDSDNKIIWETVDAPNGSVQITALTSTPSNVPCPAKEGIWQTYVGLCTGSKDENTGAAPVRMFYDNETNRSYKRVCLIPCGGNEDNILKFTPSIVG